MSLHVTKWSKICPLARLIGLGSCFDLQLALLRKNCLLKDRDTVLPGAVLAGGRAARLSHDVVMLSGEES